MGQKQSKDELLYQQVNNGNTEGIKALHREGAGLEWTDKEGKTPLIVACMNPEHYNVTKTLIDLGANVNAYCPGRHAGTPLHHAAKKGLDQTVKLLLSHGANALVMNDSCQTPLDVARFKGHANVVRTIEARICLFSGWLKELYGPGFLELLAPKFLSRKIWVAVIPCGSPGLKKPAKLELAVYTSLQDAQPRTIVALWKANMEEPTFNQPESTVMISDNSTMSKRWRRRRGITYKQVARKTRLRIAALNEIDKHRLQEFCIACKGIPQVLHSRAPEVPVSSTTAPHVESQYLHVNVQSTTAKGPTPSAPPAVDDDIVYYSPTHYPTIDDDMSLYISSPSRSAVLQSNAKPDETNDNINISSCIICLDSPVEGACIPCGHMAGCMSCLNEVKAKTWGCPVCRAKIDQVVRLYAV